jgi:hypothetical protein
MDKGEKNLGEKRLQKTKILIKVKADNIGINLM